MTDPVNIFQPSAAANRAGQAAGQTQAAIANAAQRTGVDFSYLLAQARIESGLDPQAEARTSSATGLFQFIDQTWLSTLDKHGEELGYGDIAGAIDTRNGRAQITDPAMRDAIMDLRFDPQAASLMAGALATENRDMLQPILGREPDASELYLAHFLGADGASRFLTALNQSPDTSAVALMPRAARANRAIFNQPSGAPRSVSEVMGVIRGRVQTAMGQQTSAPLATPIPGMSPFGQTPLPGLSADNFPTALATPDWYPASSASPVSSYQPSAPQISRARVAPSAPPLPQAAPPTSMADTLRDSFSLASSAGASPSALTHIRNAYAKLEAFGL